MIIMLNFPRNQSNFFSTKSIKVGMSNFSLGIQNFETNQMWFYIKINLADL